MLITSRNQRGFTMIELLIAVTISGTLLVMGVPAFTQWIQNSQTRTAAESIQNGLQIARAEAVRRNTNVRFNLTDAAGKPTWTVCLDVTTPDCAAANVVQSRSADEGGGNARIGASVAALPSPIPAGHFATAIAAGTALPAGVTFDGLGRIPLGNVGTDISRIDVTNAKLTTARRMVIVIGTGGQTRMCDPALTLASNPQGCS